MKVDYKTFKIEFSNDKIPVFVEPRVNAKFDFVKYGEGNNYPEFLLTIFSRSARRRGSEMVGD